MVSWWIWYVNHLLKLSWYHNVYGYHLLQKLSLPESKIKALDYLEKISQNEEYVLSYDLRTNDMGFFNNHRILHGRTSFVDHQDQNLKRLMIRIWIKDM